MSNEEENNSKLPKLTMGNWATEFRDAFKDYALGLGEAAEIIISGEDRGVDGDVREPTPDMRVLVVDEEHPGQFIEGDEFRYPHAQNAISANGWKLFERDYERWRLRKTSKLKVISKLLISMDREVRNRVEAANGFNAAYQRADLLALWNMTEQTVRGRGAISVYSLTARFFRMKQKGPEDWARYAKEWRGTVEDLLRFGAPEDVLNAMFNTHLVMSVDQTQFKEKLTPIYGRNNWPAYADLMLELNTYAANTERMKEFQGDDKGEGKEKAYETQANTGNKGKGGCWNCGSYKHLRSECPKPPNKCNECGKMGHIEKYCRLLRESNDRDQQHRPKGKGKPRLYRNPKEGKKKEERVRKERKKARGKAYSAEESENSESEEEEEYEEEAEESEGSYVVKINIEMEEEGLQAMKAEVNADINPTFILDTGCKRLNICKDEGVLSELTHINATVTGISGANIKADKVGELPIAGRTLLIPEADANLISVRQLINLYGGRYEGNEKVMTVYDRNNKVVLRGKTNPDNKDFWVITYKELLKYEEARSAKAYPAAQTQQVGQALQLPQDHHTVEERNRALEAWKLCALWGHPGYTSIMRDLDNGTRTDTHLTSRDVKLGLKLFGPCTACMEGKMKAPTEPTSTTPPATDVGEHLHADLIPLKATSVGGNTVLLAVLDEKSNFLATIPMKTKTTEAITSAFDQVVAFYNTHGHCVKRVTTDGEKVLKSLKLYLAQKKIDLTTTPAGLHEKRVERAIQTLKGRRRAMLASLPYELPPQLEAESYIAATTALNSTSSSNTAPYTPYHLVTGRKPFQPQFYFGQTGLFHARRTDKPNARAEWGIFLSYGDAPGSLRAYIPSRSGVYSHRKFIPHPAVPAEWKYKPRLTVDKTQKLQPVGEPIGLPNPIQPTPDLTDLEENEPSSLLNIHSPPYHQEGENSTIGTTNNAIDDSVVEPITPTTTHPETPTSQHQEGGQNQSVTVPASTRLPRKAKENRGWIEGRHNALTIKDIRVEIHNAYRISLTSALRMKDKKDDIETAIKNEIDNMMEMKVVKPIPKHLIPNEHKKKVIPAHMFLKFKYKANGSFDKVKARLVANGNLQHPESIGDTFSPTVTPITVNAQLDIAARQDHYISSYDIKGAFLMTRINKGNRIFIKVSKNVSTIWIQYYPEMKKYLTNEDELYFELLKFMYGLPEAPRQFNKLLNKVLTDIGFQGSKADECLYYKDTPEGRLNLSTHVDDMLLTSPTKELRTWFEDEIKKHFDIVPQRDNISYLGINITHDRKEKKIYLTQEGYIKEVIKKYVCFNCPNNTKHPHTPATQRILMDPDDIEDNKKVDRKEFLSLVMTLMYAARFTRPDILLPTTVLATRCTEPKESDMRQALRIVKYLAGTPKIGLILDGKTRLTPHIYADASHISHYTGHGHGGILISFGSAPIFSRSYKIKAVTRSSSETELYALEEAATYAVWLKLLLRDLLGREYEKSITIYQDNLSTMIMANENKINFKRTKHLLVRESYVKEQIQKGHIQLKHKPSDQMHADFLTKPLNRTKLETCMELLNIQSA